MRRRLARLWLVAVCACVAATAAGCKKEASPDAVLAEVDSFTAELLKRVDAASDPSAGVEEAQKLMDERRAEMASKIASVKKSEGFESNEELRRRMLESEISNGAKVSGLQTRYIKRSMDDEAFKERLEKLVNDYQLMFKV